MKKTTYRHLGPEQRYQIHAFLLAGQSQAFIARQLGVARSTISRELARNSTHSAKPPDKYKPANAQAFADHRAYKRAPAKSTDPAICRRLHFLLSKDWSPQQIAATCKGRGLAMLSAEGIYLWIYKLRRSGGADYTQNLRHRHGKRRKRRLTKHRRPIIKDRVSIHQRPEVVTRAERSGDLETDLVHCKGGYLLTITDRTTLFNFLVPAPQQRSCYRSGCSYQRARPAQRKALYHHL